MLEKIKEILTDFIDISTDQMSEKTELVSDLGLSSLDVVNIVVAFEDEFNIEIPDSAIKDFNTIGNIVEYLENHI